MSLSGDSPVSATIKHARAVDAAPDEEGNQNEKGGI